MMDILKKPFGYEPALTKADLKNAGKRKAPGQAIGRKRSSAYGNSSMNRGDY